MATTMLLMEGMFMINTSPLGSHSTFGDYARFLTQRYIAPHFSRGCTEVHLLFDNPGQLKDTPKFFEHKRRDESATIATGHTCDDINESTRLPTKWRENVLHCCKCKRTLVCFLAEFMLKHMHSHLSPHQKFYIAGVFAEHLQTCIGLWKEAAVHNQIQCIPAMQKKQTPCCGYMLRRHTAIKY